jgi:hypothetical protein
MINASVKKGRIRVRNIPNERAFGIEKIGTNPVPEQDRRTREMFSNKVKSFY